MYNGVMKENVRITLRLPAEIHRAIVELSEEENRSANGQIVRALRAYLETKTTPSPPRK